MYASFLDQHGDVKKHVLAAIVYAPPPPSHSHSNRQH